MPTVDEVLAAEEINDAAVFRVIDLMADRPDRVEQYELVADRLTRLARHLRGG